MKSDLCSATISAPRKNRKLFQPVTWAYCPENRPVSFVPAHFVLGFIIIVRTTLAPGIIWGWKNLMFRSGTAGAVGYCALLLAACARSVPSVTEGRSLYFANGCVSCHGSSGRGDGPMSKTLPSPPTDLRNRAFFKRGSGEDAIARTLAEGVLTAETSVPQLHHTHHELAMPKFAHLTDLERRSIALYVISLQGREQP